MGLYRTALCLIFPAHSQASSGQRGPSSLHHRHHGTPKSRLFIAIPGVCSLLPLPEPLTQLVLASMNKDRPGFSIGHILHFIRRTPGDLSPPTYRLSTTPWPWPWAEALEPHHSLCLIAQKLQSEGNDTVCCTHLHNFQYLVASKNFSCESHWFTFNPHKCPSYK